MGLPRQAIEDAALVLGVDTATILAVDTVESRGTGMDSQGRPKILFEPHVFSRLTARKFDKAHPSISYPKWIPKAPSYARDQHQVLSEARFLDAPAAVQACSWGRYQLMGFNWSLCGFDTLADFEEAMRAGESQQLAAFLRFVVSHPAMLRALQRKDWAGFAERYNGPGYAANNYHVKLANAYTA